MATRILKDIENLGPVLAAIHQSCFTGKGAWSSQTFEELMAFSTHYLCVDFQNDQTVTGFILYNVVMDQSEIITLAVLPDFRRKGVAANMIDAMLCALIQQKVHRSFLEVNQDNEPAIGLYLRCGYAKIGQRLHYYGHGQHADIMSKKLES